MSAAIPITIPPPQALMGFAALNPSYTLELTQRPRMHPPLRMIERDLPRGGSRIGGAGEDRKAGGARTRHPRQPHACGCAKHGQHLADHRLDAGGRRLDVPPRGTRPTTDRVREALFNVLAARRDFDGLRVMDLYAGSGALGLEALSRGAASALFVESDSRAAAVIKRNVATLGLPGATVRRGAVASVTRAGRACRAAASAVRAAIARNVIRSVTMAGGPKRRIIMVHCAIVNRFTIPYPGWTATASKPPIRSQGLSFRWKIFIHDSQRGRKGRRAAGSADRRPAH